MATRDPFATSDIVSRRGGPAKAPLSRDAIVTLALEQLTRDGLEAMSLRKVAAALETGPASLYVYVKDLEELQALVFDRALLPVVARRLRQKEWRRRVQALLHAYLDVLVASPGLAQLAFRRVAVGPNALRVFDTLLGELMGAGADGQAAAWAVDLLLLYVTGVGAEHGKRSDAGGSGNAGGAGARAIMAVSADDYPNIHAARDAIVSGSTQRVSWAIDSILNGVVPSTGDPPAAAAAPRSAKRKS